MLSLGAEKATQTKTLFRKLFLPLYLNLKFKRMSKYQVVDKQPKFHLNMKDLPHQLDQPVRCIKLYYVKPKVNTYSYRDSDMMDHSCLLDWLWMAARKLCGGVRHKGHFHCQHKMTLLKCQGPGVIKWADGAGWLWYDF